MVVSLCFGPVSQSVAQLCSRDAMLVFDGSASMAELGFGASGPSRIDEARSAVSRVLPDAAALRRIGLLTYGPGSDDACQGIELRFAPAPNAAQAIQDTLAQLDPTGLTPLTASVRAAADVLDYRNASGIVVLVTDGSETCGGDPCVLGHDLAAHAADLTVHVIGFRLVFDPFSWNGVEAYETAAAQVSCLAAQTGGTYVTTETVDELAEALRETLGCSLIGSVNHFNLKEIF